MKKQGIALVLIVALGTSILVNPSTYAAAKAKPCRFGGGYKTEAGKISGCLWVNGKGTWLSYPKRNANALTSYEKTKLKAYQEIYKLYIAGPLNSITLKYDISSSLPAELKQKYIDQTERASQFYDGFFTKPTIVNAYYQTEKDEKYIKSHPVLKRDAESFNSWYSECKKVKVFNTILV